MLAEADALRAEVARLRALEARLTALARGAEAPPGSLAFSGSRCQSVPGSGGGHMNRVRWSCVALVVFGLVETARAQSDAVVIRSSDGSTEQPRLAVTTSVTGPPAVDAQVRVQNADLHALRDAVIGPGSPNVGGSAHALTISATNGYLSTNTAALELQVSNSSSVLPHARISFYNGIGGGTESARIEHQTASGRTDLGQLVFYTRRDPGAIAERMRIDPDGDVGIGTAGGTHRLDVGGAINTSEAYRIGGNVVLSNTGTQNTFVGRTGLLGSSNTFVGHTAGSATTATGLSNTYLGSQAGLSNTTGDYNVAIGADAGLYATTATGNVAIGYISGRGASGTTTGSYNTYVGYQSGHAVTSGAQNTFLGGFAGLRTTTAISNVAVGYFAAVANVTGFQNTNVGTYAGYGLNAVTGSGRDNTLLGDSAGYRIDTGSFNTAVGSRAGYNNAAGSSNVFLGYAAGYDETGSNKLYIANSSTPTPLIYGDFSAGALTVNGTLTVTGALSASGGLGTGLTPGSVAFAGAGGALSQDNAAFFWDATNDRLGIGTGSPLDRLHVVGSAGATGSYASGSNLLIDSGDGQRFITMRGPNSGQTGLLFSNSDTFVDGGMRYWPSATAGAERLELLAGGGDRFYVLGNGNVGIGTSAPGARLDVSGTARVSGQLTSTVTQGTAPFVVGSTTVVGSLNADMVDGQHYSSNWDLWQDMGTYMAPTGSGAHDVRVYESDQAYGHYSSQSSTTVGGAWYGQYVYRAGPTTTTAGYGIQATAEVYGGGGTGGTFYGVHGTARWGTTSYGVYGQAPYANSAAYGVYGSATSSSGTNYGVFGTASGGAASWAGYFAGNVAVTGGLVDLTNGASNTIQFGSVGVTAPGSSAGWKLRTWGTTYGIGIDSGTQWYAADAAHRFFTWNGAGWVQQAELNETELALTGTGQIRIGSVETLRDAGGFILDCNVDFNPSANNTNDLGSSTMRWAYVYGVISNFSSSIKMKKDVRRLERDEVDRLVERARAMPIIAFRFEGEDAPAGPGPGAGQAPAGGAPDERRRDRPVRTVPRLGSIAEQMPPEILGEEGDGVDVVAYCGLLLATLQRTLERVDELEERVRQLESR